ncbi:MAG TPA: hypothetical protein VF334_11690, partial [Polyangia bacterium]
MRLLEPARLARRFVQGDEAVDDERVIVERPGQLRGAAFERAQQPPARRLGHVLADELGGAARAVDERGLAEAGRIFGDAALVDGARRTAEFIATRMTESSRGRLLRTFKGGTAKLPGTLDDHAHVVDGLLALYEASGEA